jgi:hypothetical protein
MAADDFFQRWSRRKAGAAEAADVAASAAMPTKAAVPRAAEAAAAVGQPAALPTLEDVARLTGDSDFTPFIARGVDETVKRSALKKLFSDPHFNVMDGLDIYIGDYNTFQPIPAEMLALLDHAKGVLDPLSQFEQPVMRMITDIPELELNPASGSIDEADIASATSADDAAAAPVESDPAVPDGANPDMAGDGAAATDAANPVAANPVAAMPDPFSAATAHPQNLAQGPDDHTI